MKRLDRYIVREMFLPLLIGTVVIALLFLANEVIAIFKNFNVQSIPATAILQLLMYKMPFWLQLTLPVGIALGAALAISRMARESELTAMRAAGISIRRVLWPVALIGALVGVANFAIVEFVVPKTQVKYRQLLGQLGVLALAPRLQSNVMIRIDQYTASIGQVSRAADGSLRLEDVMIVERPRDDEWRIYTSVRGSYRDGVWRMERPVLFHMRGLQMLAGRSTDTLEINERIQVEQLFANPEPEEQTIQTLGKAIREGRAAGIDMTNQEIAYQVKFSIPASCLIFAVTSSLLAIRMSRAGPFVGVLVSLGLVILYYNVYIVSTEIFGPNRWLDPVMAAWAPNILYLLLGFVLLRGAE